MENQPNTQEIIEGIMRKKSDCFIHLEFSVRKKFYDKWSILEREGIKTGDYRPTIIKEAIELTQDNGNYPAKFR